MEHHSIPIALAIRDSAKDLLNVEVGDQGVSIQLEDGTEFHAQLPRMKWMRLYDKGITERSDFVYSGFSTPSRGIRPNGLVLVISTIADTSLRAFLGHPSVKRLRISTDRIPPD